MLVYGPLLGGSKCELSSTSAKWNCKLRGISFIYPFSAYLTFYTKAYIRLSTWIIQLGTMLSDHFAKAKISEISKTVKTK